ncbi:hypothetical protein P7M77_17365 [Vibrio parahaemolyticus]|nr:hypothetical protein [Vibrio parahaemolyticus]MDF5671969.1 hypothetical protein [Vibrio parahaemolyticus]MDG2686374.1 hypothetical protein [Vibrio parahaemolyticus]MDG2731822.1 hypothetical protein [Vibrio parahaemolyticus]HBC3578745.1 hypothetical protein [Vibrio parahaemolyticus]
MSRSITDLPWFETFNECVRENFVRSSILERSEKEEAQDLGVKLFRCAEGEIICNSAACKVCNHRYRVERIDNLVRKIKRTRMCCKVLTVIDYSRSVRREDLCDDITKKAKARWAQTLRRARVKGPVFGAVELDFHEECSMWLLHIHFIYADTEHNRIAIKEFRKRIGKQQKLHIKENRRVKPTMRKKMRNPYRQVSYIYKLCSFRVIDYYDKKYKKNRTKKFRLNKPETIDILCFMDRVKRQAFLFRYEDSAFRD